MAVPRITKEELKLRLDGPPEKRPLVIDVRLKYPYEHSTVTLTGAVRMPPGGLDASRLPRDRDIVLYDSDPEELVSTRVASELIRRGVSRVRAGRRHRGVGERETPHRQQAGPTGRSASNSGRPQGVTETRPLTLGRAWDLLAPVLELLTDSVPSIEHLEAAGDVRRYEPLVSSLVLVGRAADPEAALDTVCSMPGVTITDRTGKRVVVRHERTEAALFLCAADDYGSTLFRETGAREHVSRVSGRFSGARLHASERDVYTDAGLAYVPPELRQDAGEIEAAESGQLPGTGGHA